MRKIAFSLRQAFSMAKKPMDPIPHSPQVYNSMIQLDCGKVYAKVQLHGPYPKILYPDVLHLKIYKSLSIRCINKSQMYQKGSVYTVFDFNLKDLRRFFGCDWQSGEVFFATKPNQHFRAELDKNMQIFDRLINSNRIESSVAQKDSKVSKKQQVKQIGKDNSASISKGVNSGKDTTKNNLLNIEIKTQKSQTQFQMKMSDFYMLKRIAQGSLPQLYGLTQFYQFNLNNLVSRFQNGKIGEEDQFDQQNFVL